MPNLYCTGNDIYLAIRSSTRLDDPDFIQTRGMRLFLVAAI